MPYTQKEREAEREESRKVDIPKAAKKAYVVGKEDLYVRISGDEEWLEPYGITDDESEYVVFECGDYPSEKGDEVPMEVVEKCYNSFGDTRFLLCNGNDGVVGDTPRVDTDASDAFQKFQ